VCAASQADASFDSFLSALDASQEQVVPFAAGSKFLALVQQAGAPLAPTMWGDADAPGRLLIRTAYPPLWALILAQKAAVDARTERGYGTVVGGNSGTGKTSFLAYVLKQLRSQANPPVVVFEDLSEDAVYVFRPGRPAAERYSRLSMSPGWLLKPEAGDWYLVDTGAKATRGPDKTNAFTLVVASPHAAGKELIEGWSKEKGSPPSLYMPCWTEQELQIARQLVAPTAAEKGAEVAPWNTAVVLAAIDKAVVTERFAKYGGIARVAFATDKQLAKLLKGLTRAYDECNLHKVAQHAGTALDLLPETSSWLLHYDVDPKTFELRQVEFASDSILEEVWKRNEARKDNAVLEFVNSTSDNTVWASAAGKLFEKFLGHSLLQQGGSFTVQQLVNPASSAKGAKSARHAAAGKLVLPPSPHPAATLADAAAIGRLAPQQYGQPSNDNFPTIDGVLKPNLLFQMTVGRKHGVNIDGLLAAVAALQLPAGSPTPPRLYFVVPPQQFAAFRVGTFTSSAVPPTPVGNIPANVEYWVLLYEVSDKRKQPATVASPPPSPKVAKTQRVLPPGAAGATSCSCKGPCRTNACSCRQAGQHCHATCHSALAKALTDPLDRHKNCTNHTQP
jgi:hypothetical protein